MGRPVQTATVCSDCGLPWEQHNVVVPPRLSGGSLSDDERVPASECIRLLKAELHRRGWRQPPVRK